MADEKSWDEIGAATSQRILSAAVEHATPDDKMIVGFYQLGLKLEAALKAHDDAAAIRSKQFIDAGEEHTERIITEVRKSQLNPKALYSVAAGAGAAMGGVIIGFVKGVGLALKHWK